MHSVSTPDAFQVLFKFGKHLSRLDIQIVGKVARLDQIKALWQAISPAPNSSCILCLASPIQLTQLC